MGKVGREEDKVRGWDKGGYKGGEGGLVWGKGEFKGGGACADEGGGGVEGIVTWVNHEG